MLPVLWKCLGVGLVAGVWALLLQYLWGMLKWKLRRDLPPGPLGLPLLGYLPFMPKDHHDVEEMKKKYGNVFGFSVASRYVVFLCDFDSVKEALSQDALLHRPDELPLRIHEKSEGLIVLNGARWKEQRRFSLKTFKTLGMATPAMERHIREEVSHLKRELESLKGKPVLPAVLLTPSMSNVISALVFGRRFEYDDPERIYLDKLIEVIPALAAQMSIFHFFLWLRKLLVFFRVGLCYQLRDALVRREEFADSKISMHKETYKDGVVRDYIDSFLVEMKQENGEKNKTFTRNLLRGNVSAFFGAGSETVRSSVEWLLLMCAAKPHLQRRVQAEIDEAFEEDQKSHLSWSDRNRVPYTQAFIWETMRYRPVIPLNLMRTASTDVKVGNYVIPRDSIVISSHWSIFHDASFWGDPEVFRPERFLAEDGTRPRKPEPFIPFSYGKRACPGEIIANMEIFIYFTAIMQHFTVETPPDGPASVLDEVTGLSARPEPQQIIFRARRVRA